MQKIKFKIAYKPLTDNEVNKHKNFDALMGMYAAAPKLNFFQKLFKNKWTMFSSGLITGSIIATIVALNSGQHNTPIAQLDQQIITNQIADTNSNTTINSTTLNNTSTENNTTNNEVETAALLENIQTTESANATVTTSNNSNKQFNGNINTNLKSNTPVVDATLTKAENSTPNETITTANTNNTPANITQPESNVNVAENNTTNTSTTTEKTSAAILSPANEQTKPEVIDPQLAQTENKVTPIENSTDETLIVNNTISEHPTTTTPENPVVKQGTSSTPTADTTGNLNAALNDISDFAVNIGKKANQVIEKMATKSPKQDESANNKTNGLPDTIAAEKSVPDAPLQFIDRYAQLSFFTPLSTNGMEGYKYYHHFSINAIQGYNGAVQGLEVGGVINADKGYVIGGQFGGVGNIIGGDLKGIQGAGVFNFAKSVLGAQYAGVANYSISGMQGMQGAGVINYSAGQIDGMQAAGVINIASGIKYNSKLFQASGVANISLSHNLIGMQVSGVLNAANNITGAQIGLVNIAKNVKGTQIGLINIADTIDGVAIGLLSFSRNGIFDVDVFTSDLFRANVALRFGSPYVYNTFAIGINPAKDTMQYGYGFGIGGHIPVFPKLSVDIDGMTWTTFEDNFDFNYDYFQLMNQFRIMPSYAITNYLSVYGGPVINVEVYDNDIDPIRNNTFASYEGVNVTTGLSMGYVFGIRLF